MTVDAGAVLQQLRRPVAVTWWRRMGAVSCHLPRRSSHATSDVEHVCHSVVNDTLAVSETSGLPFYGCLLPQGQARVELKQRVQSHCIPCRPLGWVQESPSATDSTGFGAQAGPSKNMNWYYPDAPGGGGTAPAGRRGTDNHAMNGNAVSAPTAVRIQGYSDEQHQDDDVTTGQPLQCAPVPHKPPVKHEFN